MATHNKQTKNYSFFQNTKCEYFPCHKNIDANIFNCLFCYCPLYVLGKECGGNPQYTEKGIKDCTQCKLPHRRENYEYVISQFNKIIEKMNENA